MRFCQVENFVKVKFFCYIIMLCGLLFKIYLLKLLRKFVVNETLLFPSTKLKQKQRHSIIKIYNKFNIIFHH